MWGRTWFSPGGEGLVLPPSAPALCGDCSTPVGRTASTVPGREGPDRERTAAAARLGPSPNQERCFVTVVEMHVPGMTCRHCVRAVTARLRDLPGVVSVQADAEHARLVVQGDVTAEQVRAALEGVSLAPGSPEHDATQ